MRVQAGRIVSIEYQVRLGDGEVVEATEADHPVQYLHGAGMLLPSLESALDQMEEGSRKRFVIGARDAYGDRDESSVVTLPRSIFPANIELEVGTRLAARTSGGDTYPLTVRQVLADRVVVDLNHPLAGKDLHFEVAVRAVRSAGADEVFTGKPHPVEIV
jgi:FKBP-type peptidyl-prolyl cis-trans isomerase SlyD